MEDNLTPKQRSDIKKAKKRARINTATGEDVEMIPAVRGQKNIFDDSAKKLVGIYVRVSTDDSNQTMSYEMQKAYYEDFVKNHPNWTLVEIFADAYTTKCKSALKKGFEFATGKNSTLRKVSSA